MSMRAGRDYVAKPNPAQLCSRCAMSAEKRATWPEGCPLVRDLRHLCPYKPQRKEKTP